MGTVVLAHDTLLDRQVALKRMAATTDPRALSRLRREALVGASLSHPNLVSIYDVVGSNDGAGSDDDGLVIVMEYVHGLTLRDVLSRRGELPARYGLRLLEGVAAGLDAIHRRGIVHRDVKPPNILLGADGAVKLADLGIASVPGRTRITSAGTVLGSFSYMAPEQLADAPSAPAIDVYALAAVAFEVLSGRKARRETNPVALAHAIATQPAPDLRDAWPAAPRAAAELLTRGMSRDPAKRPASAGELVARLRATLEPQGPTRFMPAPAASSAATLAVPRLARRARDPEAPKAGAAAAADGQADGGPMGSKLSAAGMAGSPASRSSVHRGPSPVPRRLGPVQSAVTMPSARSVRPERRQERSAGRGRRNVASAAGVRRSGPATWTVYGGATRFRQLRRWLVAAALVVLTTVVLALVVLNGMGASRPKTQARQPARHRAHAVGTASRAHNSTRKTAAGNSPNAAHPPGGSVAPNPAVAAPAAPPASRSAGRELSGNGATPAGSSVTSSSLRTPAAAPAPSAAGSPISAVESFYELAASHRYADAWALADPTFRSQLKGYQGFQADQEADRSIIFDAAQIVRQSTSSSTVAVKTTSVRTTGTQHCAGTVDLSAGSSSGWLLHLIHINCT